MSRISGLAPKHRDESPPMKGKSKASKTALDKDSTMSSPTGAVQLELPLFANVELAQHSQRDDLARQVEFMRERHPKAEIVQDIGSGLNFKRKGLQALLVRLMRPDQLQIVVACRDRLCRFGFELFEFMVKQNGGEILVLSSPVHGQETELTAALLAILHVDRCRMHGLRSYSQKIKQDPNIPKC